MKKTDMKKVRELLQLVIGQGHSSRQAAKVAGMSKSSASEYVSGFKSSGLDLDGIAKLSDSELLKSITGPNGKQANERYADLLSRFTYIEKELLRPGVTLQLLWEELFSERPNSYSYSQFCFHYGQWSKIQEVGMHMEHKAGDKLYVDFTGVKQSIVDAATGEIREAEVFVGVMGGSQKAYIEAVWSQKKAEWIKVNENALRFFGGVPCCIVPDCLKSAVTKADRYEPQVNQTYKDFGDHYGTVILPARGFAPKRQIAGGELRKNGLHAHLCPLAQRAVLFSGRM